MESSQKKKTSVSDGEFYFSLFKNHRGMETALIGSQKCVTVSAEHCSQSEGSLRCFKCAHAHIQTQAAAPGFSGTMSLSQSPTFPTAVVRRRLLRHG